MGWYDKVQQTKVNQNGQGLGAGEYILQVIAQREKRSERGGGTFFITEFLVIQSTNGSHPVGSKGAQVIRLDGRYPDSALADVKANVSACSGVEPTSPDADTKITPMVCEAATHPSQPNRGVFLAATVYPKPPKDNPAGKPYMKFALRPILENGQPKRGPLPAGLVADDHNAPAQPLPAHGGGYAPPAPAAHGAPAYAMPPAYGAPGYVAPGTAPMVPVAPVAPVFPPAGWQPHPQAPGYFYKPALGATSPVPTEAQLRALMAAGQA